jgi:energy-coupling factor transporter ATP-binding protein EcfA2
MAVKAGVNPGDLAETGWGVILADGADPAIKEALGELLQHRQEQAGERYKEYTGPDGYRPDESKSAFLTRRGAAPGLVDPDRVPYYLLIAGDPETIPFTFQYRLDVQYAVGRIRFDTLEEYANYARSVVRAETGQVALPRQAAFFGPQNPGDRATQLGAEHLVKPLADSLAQAHPDWTFRRFLAEAATKAHLARLLVGDQTPALLFFCGHGMGFALDDPRQLPHTGALLCQDWPGPGSGPIPEEHYFSGDDLASDARLLGLLAFLFSSYSAGTPRMEDFHHRSFREPQAIAPHAFVANLPQRLLAHPLGGAMAVIGIVERGPWAFSFMPPYGSTGVFEETMTRLLEGQPVGYAMEPFNERYADLAYNLSLEREEIKLGQVPDDMALAQLQTAVTDARNYVILGDPAVRLVLTEPPAERVPIAVTEQPLAVTEQPLDLKLGLTRMEELLAERAPVLRPAFDEPAAVLRAILDREPETLGEADRARQEEALAALDDLCQEALEIGFEALARGEEPPDYDGRCPFRGLHPFRGEQHDFFFGRDESVAQMQRLLAGGNLLAVVGPSGCGKSSLLLAGLIPALQVQNPELQTLLVRPEGDLLPQFFASLSEVQGRPALLVVDQFETLFDPAISQGTRQVFMEHLLQPPEQMQIVLAMRSDAWGALEPYEQLAEAMERSLVELEPLGRSELRQAMERQATAVGLRFEEGMGDTILDDVCRGPGAMPLLQQVLQALWERRHGRWLKHREYEASGGARQALLATADGFHRQLPPKEQDRECAILLRLVPPSEQSLPGLPEPERRPDTWAERLVPMAEMAGALVLELAPDQQARVRDIFLRLAPAEEGAAGQEPQRHSLPMVSFEELVPAGRDPAPVRVLVKRLADARLVVTSRAADGGQAQVAMVHPTLHQSWPVLSQWLEKEEKNLKLRQRIGATARAWDLQGRDDSLLLHRGESLQLAGELSAHPMLALNALETAYRDACLAQEEQEQAEAKQMERDWQSLQVAAQESEAAGVALTTLAESFEEMAIRHRQLRSLLKLSQHLRDLRNDFGRCLEVVERAGMDVTTLKLNELKSNWQHVQQRQVELQVFVETYPRGDLGAWFQLLQTSATELECDLLLLALGSLPKRASEFDTRLAEAETRILVQLEQAINELVKLSDRTLGRLAQR